MKIALMFSILMTLAVSFAQRELPSCSSAITYYYYMDRHNDDAQEGVNGVVNLTNTGVGLGDVSAGQDIVGLMFENIYVPERPYTITNATLSFKATATSTEPAELKIFPWYYSDIYTTQPYSLSTRQINGDAVYWDVPDWVKGDQGPAQQVDITSLITPVQIDEGIVPLGISGTGIRRAWAFRPDWPKDTAPVLSIKFLVDNSVIYPPSGCTP